MKRNLLFNQATAIGKRLAMVLTMLLMLGVTQVWGALSSPYTCTFTTDLTLNDKQVKTGDVTWTLSTTVGKGSPTTTFGNTNSQSAIKLGSGKNNYYSKMTLTTSAFSSYNITKVVLYISSNNGGSKTITVKQGNIQIGTGNQSFTSINWVTNCTRNTTKGSGGDLSIEISSDATATFIHSIAITYEETIATKTLSSISVNGQTTSYNVGDVFSFDGTCTAKYSDNSTKTVTPSSVSSPDMNSAGNKTVTVSYTEGGITVNATYTITVTAPAGGGGSDDCDNPTWQLVTNVSDLAVGDEIVIAASTQNYALSTTQRNANRQAVAITKSDDAITINENVQVITLTTATNPQTNTFSFHVGTGFLYASSSSNNELKTTANPEQNGDWYLEIKNTGVASITAQGDKTRKVMQFNLNNNDPAIFACYSSASQTSLAIYKKVCTAEPTVCVIPKCGGGWWRHVASGNRVVCDLLEEL